MYNKGGRTYINIFRTREKDMLVFFSQENNFIFCHDIRGILEKMGFSKQIDGQLINEPAFINSTNEAVRKAWTSFVTLVGNFLGNRKAESYIELVQ